MLPAMVIRNFSLLLLDTGHPKNGVENKVLDFYDDPDETSAGITNQIKARLTENSLSLENIS
jgi:hypothetical protein